MTHLAQVARIYEAAGLANDEARNAAITSLVQALRSRGVPISEALDAVLGAGSYAALAGQLWDAAQRVA